MTITRFQESAFPILTCGQGRQMMENTDTLPGPEEEALCAGGNQYFLVQPAVYAELTRN